MLFWALVLFFFLLVLYAVFILLFSLVSQVTRCCKFLLVEIPGIIPLGSIFGGWSVSCRFLFLRFFFSWKFIAFICSRFHSFFDVINVFLSDLIDLVYLKFGFYRYLMILGFLMFWSFYFFLFLWNFCLILFIIDFHHFNRLLGQKYPGNHYRNCLNLYYLLHNHRLHFR